MEDDQSKSTHFGYQQVPLEEKANKVAGVFSSVAQSYDVMNDVMSLGIHRLWKRFTAEIAHVRPGNRILDIAGGTGDIAALLANKLGGKGDIVLADINPDMLAVGRDRLIDKGLTGNLHFIQANAEHLPFPDNHFDLVTIAFGLRNVTRKELALAEMFRVLKPGCRALILEFSKPVLPGLGTVYDTYSFKILPLMGKLIAKDEDSYRYLAESIRMHPDQDSLKQMMEHAGFERCDYINMSGGIVALHRGYKL
jgi:demethylmenaquinone methyltransferase/2-methoxy-6-polyprenyl-1,4-benzoquinol methylase